jgi:hypothetical protein
VSRWWPYMPGVPAMGHVTSKGYWHPGNGATCPRCNPTPSYR